MAISQMNVTESKASSESKSEIKKEELAEKTTMETWENFELNPDSFFVYEKNKEKHRWRVKSSRLMDEELLSSDDELRKGQHTFSHSKGTNLLDARVITEELFRLLIPYHPETRRIVSRNENKEGSHSTLSKEIKDAKPLPLTDDGKCVILQNQCFYYGSILAGILWTCDSDIHRENLLLNHEDQLTKIDGDYGFSNLLGHRHSEDDAESGGDDDNEERDEKRRKTKSYDITEETISTLPKLSESYLINNWPPIIVPDDGKTECRHGINVAIVKIATYPDKFLSEYLAYHIKDPAVHKFFYDEIINRKNMLLNAVKNNADFRNYLETMNAERELLSYVGELKEFKIRDKYKPFKEEYGIEMQDNFKNLRNSILKTNVITASSAVGSTATTTTTATTCTTTTTSSSDAFIMSRLEVDAATLMAAVNPAVTSTSSTMTTTAPSVAASGTGSETTLDNVTIASNSSFSAGSGARVSSSKKRTLH